MALGGSAAVGAQATRLKNLLLFVSAPLARSAPWRGTALNKKTAVFSKSLINANKCCSGGCVGIQHVVYMPETLNTTPVLFLAYKPHAESQHTHHHSSYLHLLMIY